MAVPSLILDLLILWFIWSLITGRRSQRRQQERTQKTEARTKQRPVKRVRRGLTGPSYQEEDEESGTPSAEVLARAKEPAREAGGGFAATKELMPQQPQMPTTVLQEHVTPKTVTIAQGQPSERTVSLTSDNLLAPSTLVQSLILMQALSEPRCKRAWRAR